MRVLIVVGLLGSCVACAARSPRVQSPRSLFQGKWKTHVPLTSAVSVPSGISFTVSPDTVTVTTRLFFTAHGNTVEFAETFCTDGQPHPHASEPGWTTVATWVTPYLLDVVYAGPGGYSVVHATYTVSPDRKTLTVGDTIFYR